MRMTPPRHQPPEEEGGRGKRPEDTFFLNLRKKAPFSTCGGGKEKEYASLDIKERRTRRIEKRRLSHEERGGEKSLLHRGTGENQFFLERSTTRTEEKGKEKVRNHEVVSYHIGAAQKKGKMAPLLMARKKPIVDHPGKRLKGKKSEPKIVLHPRLLRKMKGSHICTGGRKRREKAGP